MTGLLRNPLSWGLVIAFSLAFQLLAPFVGDETYFVAWGKTLVAGIYDHPALPAWISFFLREIESVFGVAVHGPLHRMFSFALGAVGLWLIGRRIRTFNSGVPVENWLVLLALVPGYLLLFNAYTNDTITGFTALWFVLACDWAIRTTHRTWFAVLVAGLGLAAMMLTKYNGAVVYLAVLLACIVHSEGRRLLFGRMVMISLVALVPFAGHIWWNINNCSINLALIASFRKLGTGTGIGLLDFWLSFLLTAGPAGFFALWIAWRQWRLSEPMGFFMRSFVAIMFILVPVSILLGAFSANWGAPLGIMAVLGLAESFSKTDLRVLHKLSVVLAVAVMGPIVGLLVVLQSGLVGAHDIFGEKIALQVELYLDLDDGGLVAQMQPLANTRVLATTDYGIGGHFDNAGFDETVVMTTSVHGRNQDVLTDFRALDGRDIVLLSGRQAADRAQTALLFDSFEIVTLETDRRKYEVVLGNGFNYDYYRENWILPVLSKYYDKSPFPYRACGMDRYR